MDKKELKFIDVTISNNENCRYYFIVYSIPMITISQIEPHSGIFPNIAMGIFKAFITRTQHLLKRILRSTNTFY